MRVSDFVLVLPVLYVVLILRAVLPLVLSPTKVFLLMAGIFPLVGWPFVARGVRAIVAREREREYVLAARSLGASRARILWRHLLPACFGHIAVQASLLLPAFILAEAALSYVGLGFPDTVPTWGTMLREAADVNELSRFPWTVTPALAIFVVTLATNLALQRRPSDRRASPDRPLVRSRPVGERSPGSPDHQSQITRSPDRHVSDRQITRSPRHEILRTLPPSGHAVHARGRRRSGRARPQRAAPAEDAAHRPGGARLQRRVAATGRR